MKHCTVSVKIESRSREVKQRSKWRRLRWLMSLVFTSLNSLSRFYSAQPTLHHCENAFDVVSIVVFFREMAPSQWDSWLRFSWNSTLMFTGAQTPPGAKPLKTLRTVILHRFRPPEAPQSTKAAIRAMLPHGLKESISKVNPLPNRECNLTSMLRFETQWLSAWQRLPTGTGLMPGRNFLTFWCRPWRWNLKRTE